ncbi:MULTISPECIES: glycosyltransferase [Saccharolobus]|uniref:glycosyltransferase n=1 Tax=Saccharolobus TaxID=2100760 RepID=UPI001F0DFD94|nr:glycosyltransferase [Saccharolobus shibatae]MCH4816767.1 glycosyltransferase [Saccharolobus shibatae]
MITLIVTYNPDTNFIFNKQILKLKEIKNNKILIIDNNSSGDLSLLKSYVDLFIKFDRNRGLGVAYNKAFSIANSLGEKWMLILDQDTEVIDTSIINKALEDYQLLSIKERVLAINLSNSFARFKFKIPNSKFYIADFSTNSGTLIRVLPILKWNEELFLDHVDTEFFFRHLKKGYYLLIYEDSAFLHKPAEGELYIKRKISKTILKAWKYIYLRNKGKVESIPYYSNDIRYYLLIRNTVYLALRHKELVYLSSLIGLGFLGLYEKKGLQAIQLFIKGIYHGVKGDLEEDNFRIFK